MKSVTDPCSLLHRLETVASIRYVPISCFLLLMLTVWQPVNQYPQLSAYPSKGQPPAVPNMMVIGGVTGPDCKRWDGSKVDPPGTNPRVITLYAPSFHINVPQAGGGWRNPNEVQGVSYGRHCCPVLRLFLDASMKYILNSGMPAAGTISGLGTYFLGLSSLSGDLANDDPIQRVIRLKQQLELDSSLNRGEDPDVRSLWNLADPKTLPPGTSPPDFQDGDEVPCGDTSTKSGNTVIAIPNCYVMT